MNRRAAFLLVLLALAIAAFFLWPEPERETVATEPTAARSEVPPPSPPDPLLPAQPSLVPSPAAKRAPMPAPLPALDDPLRHEFYGVVLDAAEKPVIGCDVRLATGRPADDAQQTT